jgi:hypothetical protein
VCTRVGKVCDKYQIPLVSGVGGVQQLEHFGKCPSTQSIPQPNYGDYYIASHATTTPYTCYDVTDANYTSYECSTHYDVMSRLCYCVDQPISPTQYLDTFGSDVEGWVSDFSQGTCTGGTTSFGRVCDGTSGGCRARMRISCPNDPGAWFYMYKRYSTAPWNTPTPHKMMLQFDWRCSSASAAHNVCGYRIKRNAPRPSDGVQTFQFSLTNATTADTGYQHFGPVDITQYASGTSYIFVQARIEDTWTGDDDHQMWMDNVQLYIQ